MSAAPLPSLPRGFRGDAVTDPHHLLGWAGASGPFWRPPGAVLRPSDTGDVALILPWARNHGLALVPRGAGTGMPGGNVGHDVVLDLSALRSVSEPIDPTEGAVRVGAGTVGAEVRRTVQAAGLDLPALPSSAPWATVGGMVACNAAGARSLRYGSIRDWAYALTVVLTDGSVRTLHRGGGHSEDPWRRVWTRLETALPNPLPWPAVRKNSSGYALDRAITSGDALDLVVGSEGTLGVVTEAVVKAEPPPAHRAVILLGVPDRAELPSRVALLRDDPLVLACEYFGRRLVELGDLAGDPRLEGLHAGDGLLLVELGGPPVEVESRVRALSRAPSGGAVSAMDPEGMEALWETRHAANPVLGRALAQGRRSTQFIEDCVVPPTRVHDFLTGLDHILDEHRTQAVVFGHVGDGNLHVNPLVDLTRSGWREEVRAILEDTVELVAGLGGTLAGEHGDGRLRTPYLHRFFDPDVIHAFGTVKAILDPAGILNPGVIVPVPGMDPLEGLGDAPAFASGTQGPEGVR